MSERQDLQAMSCPSLREGWQWVRAPQSGKWYARHEETDVRVISGDFPGEISITTGQCPDASGDAPQDVVLAVILRNDPQAILRAVIGLAKPESIEELPPHYGEVFTWLLTNGTGTDQDKIMACHQHRLDVLLDAFPYLAEDVESKRGIIQEQKTRIEILEEVLRVVALGDRSTEEAVDLARGALGSEFEEFQKDAW